MACVSATRGTRSVAITVAVVSSAFVLLATGCGSKSDSAATTATTPASGATAPEPATTSSTPPATSGEAEAAYIAAIRVNVPDLADEPDQVLVAAGRDVCAVFESGGTFDGAIEAAGANVPPGPLAVVGGPDDPLVGANASGVVLTAVRELCPQHEDQLPG